MNNTMLGLHMEKTPAETDESQCAMCQSSYLYPYSGGIIYQNRYFDR